MYELVKIKKKDEIVLVSILERNPKKWRIELIKELHTFLQLMKKEKNVQVILFTQEIFEKDPIQEEEKLLFSPLLYINLRDSLFKEIDELSIPTIAIMEGGVAGDYLEFSLMCDFRMVAEDTQLDFFFENGEMPSHIGIRKLSQLIGEMRSKELFFTGKILSAQMAQQFGLVNRIIESEHLMAESIEFAKCIKLTGPNLIGYIKAAFE